MSPIRRCKLKPLWPKGNHVWQKSHFNAYLWIDKYWEPFCDKHGQTNSPWPPRFNHLEPDWHFVQAAGHVKPSSGASLRTARPDFAIRDIMYKSFLCAILETMKMDKHCTALFFANYNPGKWSRTGRCLQCCSHGRPKVNICKVLRQPNGLTLAMQQLFLKALAPWVCFSH